MLLYKSLRKWRDGKQTGLFEKIGYEMRWNEKLLVS